jgi:hypothetical protein
VAVSYSITSSHLPSLDLFSSADDASFCFSLADLFYFRKWRNFIRSPTTGISCSNPASVEYTNASSSILLSIIHAVIKQNISTKQPRVQKLNMFFKYAILLFLSNNSRSQNMALKHMINRYKSMIRLDRQQENISRAKSFTDALPQH